MDAQPSPTHFSGVLSGMGSRRKRLTKVTGPYRFGKWTQKEHQAFLEAMNRYGNAWKSVCRHVGTRTAAQIRSHAQKYYRHLRLKKIREMRQDPKMKGAIFVVTKEYRICSSDPLHHIPCPVRPPTLVDNPPTPPQTLLKTEEPRLIVPVPCYPIYVRPIPPEFKSVLTWANPIPPFINSKQLLTPFLRQAKCNAPSASDTSNSSRPKCT